MTMYRTDESFGKRYEGLEGCETFIRPCHQQDKRKRLSCIKIKEI